MKQENSWNAGSKENGQGRGKALGKNSSNMFTLALTR